jgi:CxxC motif-containing protein
MSETRAFVCVVCPRGCALEVEVEAGRGASRVLALRGNGCKRGEDYARSEVVDPRRSLTSTVRVLGLGRRRLPVRSSASLPLGRLAEAARALDGVTITKPTACGEVVVSDLLGLGVDIIATDSIGGRN